eukprot:694796-Ditylum_brightwellii.AAC.1
MGNIIGRSNVMSGPSGYERVLSKQEYADRMRNQNRVVSSQLSVATPRGTTYHLAETADTVRARLERYNLGNGTTVSQCINNFLTAYRELNNIPGELISDSHTLSMFLHGISDPDFAMFVQIQRKKNEGLEEAVLALRKED